MQGTLALNRSELRRYLGRVGDRWQLDGAFLGGTALSGGGDQAPAARAATFTLVLVADSFDAVPWLERVRVAASLWDAGEMGAGVEAHCYTRAEFDRKRDSVQAVRDAVWHGLDLLVFI